MIIHKLVLMILTGLVWLILSFFFFADTLSTSIFGSVIMMILAWLLMGLSDEISSMGKVQPQKYPHEDRKINNNIK